MIARIGVGDAAAARRDTVEPAFVEWLEKHKEGSRPRHLLWVDQLLSTAELASGDDLLHTRDHHRDDRPGLRDTGDFGRHSGLYDLRLDLPKAGLQGFPPCAFWDKNPGWTHERIDDL